jgi:hypothetical protein
MDERKKKRFFHSWSVPLRDGRTSAVTSPTTYWQDAKFSKKMVPPNLPKCKLDSWQDCLGCDYHICIFLPKSVNCFGVMQDINDKLVSSCTCLVFPMLPLTVSLWFWWDGTRWGTHYLPNILLHLVKLTTRFPTLVCNKKIPHSFQMILQQKIVAIVTTHFSYFFDSISENLQQKFELDL